MRQRNESTEAASNIQCIEVLIAKSYLNVSTNLFRTLSVYSLENQPVKQNRDIPNSEIFRFMVYDWKRTIKKLLEEKKIPYSVVQHFSSSSIFPDAVNEQLSSDHEIQYLRALHELDAHIGIVKDISPNRAGVVPHEGDVAHS